MAITTLKHLPFRSRTGPRIRHVRRTSWTPPEAAFRRLRAMTLLEARTTVRKFNDATAKMRDLLAWLADPAEGQATPPVAFLDVCRENRLDPVITARKLLGEVPEELLKALPHAG